MFQFPGCPPLALWIYARVSSHCTGRVPPFGYPRIVARLQLPEAFRSWPRPSSAYGALASTLRSSSLDFFVALLRPIAFATLEISCLRARSLLSLPFPSAFASDSFHVRFFLALRQASRFATGLYVNLLCAVVKVRPGTIRPLKTIQDSTQNQHLIPA